jgi:hypothetical protein
VARAQKRRKPHVKSKAEIGGTVAWILALTFIGGMFWIAMTGNRICCDPTSLLVRLWRSSS